MRARLACAAVVLVSSALHAQSRVLDLSGRWRLVEPTVEQRAVDTLAITSPDQLLITHTAREITIEHPSKPGTHPEAGTFEYGSGGFVGDLPGSVTPLQGTWSVSHIGTQLVISKSATYPPNDRGVRVTIATGSMWRLDSADRLAIEFGEERAGERPKVATRVYVKVASQ
jgi:hypothetical protein